MSSIGEFFDPETPEFEGLKKASKEYFKRAEEKRKQLTLDTMEPVKVRGFGRFSGLSPEIPTLNELAITQYLDHNRIPYQKHATFEQLFPSEVPEHPDIEYDVYIPEIQVAIEVSPNWHDPEYIKRYMETGTSSEGKKNLARVLRNDALKAAMAKKHGIHLISIDPTDDINTFAERINSELVPILRTSGYHVSDWYVQQSKVTPIEVAQRESRRTK